MTVCELFITRAYSHSTQPYKPDSDSEGSDDSYKADDYDDSNDSDNWRNDYPDEPDADDGSQSDAMDYGVGALSSSSSDEEDGPTNYQELDTKNFARQLEIYDDDYDDSDAESDS